MKKKASEIKKLPMIFQIDVKKFSEDGEAPEEIQILPIGRWNHPVYGVLTITSEDIAEFKENFDKGLRKQIPITEGHEVMDEKPAIGWFTELIDRGGNGLFAKIEWTKKGKTLLAEKSYKYFSPEFYSEYEDPQSREVYSNVLVGGALTNKPYFKELEAVVMSEKIIKNNKLNFSDMDLKKLLEKKIDELSAEEKTFIKENKDQLNEDQLANFGSIFEDDGDNGDGDDNDDNNGDGNGDGDGGDNNDNDDNNGDNDDNGDNNDNNGDGGDKIEGSFRTDGKGNVVMTMAEANALSAKANAGYEASEKLRKAEVKAFSDKLIFSEQNSKGKILPKEEKKVFSFMLGLTETQRKTFAEIVESIPSSKIFEEKGKGSGTEGTAFAEMESKVKILMSEDKTLKYSEAINRVCSENKDLADRYQKELS